MVLTVCTARSLLSTPGKRARSRWGRSATPRARRRHRRAEWCCSIIEHCAHQADLRMPGRRVRPANRNYGIDVIIEKTTISPVEAATPSPASTMNRASRMTLKRRSLAREARRCSASGSVLPLSTMIASQCA